MRIAIAAAVACLSIVGVTATAQVHAAVRKHTDIPPEPLDQALRTLAKERGFQVLYLTEDVRALKTRGAVGDFTVDEALKRLLSDSHLEYKFVDDNTVSIFSESNPTSALGEQNRASASVRIEYSSGDSPKSSSEARLRLAQVDQGQTSGPASVNKPNAPGSEGKSDLEEIVVTGTHIRGEAPIGAELITISRADIEKSGYGRIEDVLAQLPQNFSVNNELGPYVPQATSGGNNSRGTEVQLRGLGVGTTLTLIDGQRQPSGGFVGDFVDISLIPASAVERIEILPDGASAIYGSDAIGGVVNFVLRRDFTGAETRFLQSSADGSAPETQVSQLFGTAWSTGHLMIGYQFDRRGDLPASERPLSALGGDYTSLGGSNLQEVPNASNPGTILNPSGVGAYKIPTGQNGTHLTAGQLIPGAYSADDVSNVWILPRQILNSAFLNASQRLNDSWELSVDGLASKREMTSYNGGAQQVVTVPSTNPFYVNPVGGMAPVQVAYDFTKDLGPRIERSTVETAWGSFQAKGQLGHDWNLALTASYGTQNSAYHEYNQILGSTVATLIADPNPATSLNVFGDGSNTNPATIQQLRYNDLQSATSDIGTFGAVADGPLMDLPGGPVRFALGTDYRNETFHAYDVEQQLNDRNSRHVYAAFGELAIPLVGPADGGPSKATRLELSIAGRYEHYSDFGSTTNPKFGLTWQPLESVRMRGTWGKSFRAPPFSDTNTAVNPQYYISFELPDPKSPTGTSNNLILTGNNPGLKQERATIWTTGVDFTPTFVHGFKTSLTYFNIDYYDKVGFLVDPYQILEEPNVFAPVIIARPPSAAQVAAICSSALYIGSNCTGVASIIDGQPLNLAAVRVAGLDFSASQTVVTDAGTFGAQIGGTRTYHNTQGFAPNAPPISVLNTVGFPISLRLQGGLSWALKGWTANAIANYTGNYNNPGATPDTVGSFTTINFNVGYAFPESAGWLAKTRLSFNVINAFDRQPPFVNQPGGYDGGNASLMGRIFSGQVVKSW